MATSGSSRRLLELHRRVRRWLSSRGVEPTGQQFFKYNIVDMDRQLEVDVGFPVVGPVTSDDKVLTGVLPVGRYATLWHTGRRGGVIGARRIVRC